MALEDDDDLKSFSSSLLAIFVHFYGVSQTLNHVTLTFN